MKIFLLLAFICAQNARGDSIEYQNSLNGYRSNSPLRDDSLPAKPPVQSPLPLDSQLSMFKSSPPSLSQKGTKVESSLMSKKKGEKNPHNVTNKWTKREMSILKQLCKMYFAKDPGPGDAVAQMLLEIHVTFKELPYVCVYMFPDENDNDDNENDVNEDENDPVDNNSSGEQNSDSNESSDDSKRPEPLKIITSLIQLVNKRGKKTLPKHGSGAQLINISEAVITLIYKVLQLIVAQFIRSISNNPKSLPINAH